MSDAVERFLRTHKAAPVGATPPRPELGPADAGEPIPQFDFGLGGLSAFWKDQQFEPLASSLNLAHARPSALRR